MEKRLTHKDGGVAGLTILLSIVVMLFVIGLMVMIFSLMSSELQEDQYTATAGSVTNETMRVNSSNPDAFNEAVKHNFRSVVISEVTNGTIKWVSANYTVSGDYIMNLTAVGVADDCKVSYTYTYDASNDVTDVINDTGTALAGVTDWFDIFVVISAMIVLILLTVIIITAIKSSGMVGGDVSGQPRNVGTA